MLSGFEKARLLRLKNRCVKTKKCKCGRKIKYDVKGSIPEQCGVCKTLGFEESRRQFLQLNMKISKVEIVKDEQN